MKKLVTTAASAAVLALAAGCGSTADGGSGGGEGQVVLGMSYAAETLDPDLLAFRHQWTYTDPIYDSLTLKDGDGSINPQLATEWVGGKDDAGFYIDFTLREGLSFPDGAKFGADTVLANVDRSINLPGSTNKTGFAGVAVEKLDDSHVRFRSAAGVGALPATLAGPEGMMISQDAIAGKVDLTKSAVGISPYSVESVQPSRVVYKANDGYWNPEAIGAKSLVIEMMPDDARLNAVLAGNMDITTLPTRMMQTAENAGKNADVGKGNQNFVFLLNSDIKPLDDLRVRQAMSMALDRKSFCDGVWEGQCDAVGQFFAPGSVMSDPALGLSLTPFDVDKAKKLVEEAGAVGSKFELIHNAGFAQMSDLAGYAQSQWAKIGLDVTLTPLAPAQAVGRFTGEKNAAMMLSATGNAFDPSLDVERILLPTGLYNVAQLPDPKVEAAAAAGKIETDHDARVKTYRQISGDAVGNGQMIPLVSQFNAFAVAPSIKGWSQPWGLNFVSLRGVFNG
ncbi:ABC transporter substrate-binding protein [Rhodococcus sp. WS3]|uniref:ABC transporter substrate-binding protein n=1 Tax=Rhodococcus sp. WS3 TaxID=2486271 RepID=UPI0016516C56|nr:ABC transporter substrate-binding protein [Rhodococcus sp. WS3]